MARKRLLSLAVLFAGILLAAGCSSFVNINERAVTIDEVIAMSDADVSSDVIISQIYSTRSKYELTSDDIIQLKKAGVDDDVIDVMVKTGERPEVYDYDYYDPYYPGSLAFRYDIYNSWSPVYRGYGWYGRPYIMRRQDGLLGRFYDYEPVRPYSRRYRPYYERRYVPPTDEHEDDNGDDNNDDR